MHFFKFFLSIFLILIHLDFLFRFSNLSKTVSLWSCPFGKFGFTSVNNTMESVLFSLYKRWFLGSHIFSHTAVITDIWRRFLDKIVKHSHSNYAGSIPHVVSDSMHGVMDATEVHLQYIFKETVSEDFKPLFYLVKKLYQGPLLTSKNLDVFSNFTIEYLRENEKVRGTVLTCL